MNIIKSLLGLSILVFATSNAFAQDKAADAQTAKTTQAAKTAPTKKTAKKPAVKKTETAAEKAKTAEKKKVEAKAVQQPQQVKPLTAAEIQQMQQEQLKKDPQHPLTAAEMQQRQVELAHRPVSEQENKKLPNKKPVREQGTPDRPLTAAEMQELAKQGKKIPPPAPPATTNSLVSNEDIKKAANDPDAAHFEFVGGESYSYGEIIENDEPTPHDFEFTNTGKKPLIIQEAHGSCGCTVPTFSKEPVLPGKKGVITVKYSSRGRVGPISKEVTITANTNPNPVVLHISGVVKSNPDYKVPPPPPPMPQPASQQGQGGK